jgi:hypothetical protein
LKEGSNTNDVETARKRSLENVFEVVLSFKDGIDKHSNELANRKST